MIKEAILKQFINGIINKNSEEIINSMNVLSDEDLLTFLKQYEEDILNNKEPNWYLNIDIFFNPLIKYNDKFYDSIEYLLFEQKNIYNKETVYSIILLNLQDNLLKI